MNLETRLRQIRVIFNKLCYSKNYDDWFIDDLDMGMADWKETILKKLDEVIRLSEVNKP